MLNNLLKLIPTIEFYHVETKFSDSSIVEKMKPFFMRYQKKKKVGECYLKFCKKKSASQYRQKNIYILFKISTLCSVVHKKKDYNTD